MGKIVFGIFTERDHASDAIEDLRDAGYDPKDVSILMKNSEEGETFAKDTGTDVVTGAAGGATTGAVVGGIAGLLAALVVPGLGAFLVGGPIAAALGLTGGAAATLSGVATGALAGGILGVLGSMGLSRDEAREYEADIEKGGIFVAIAADAGGVAEVMDILEDNSAQKIRFAQTKKTRADDFEEELLATSGYDKTEIAEYKPTAYAAGSKGGKSDNRGLSKNAKGSRSVAKSRNKSTTSKGGRSTLSKSKTTKE